MAVEGGPNETAHLTGEYRFTLGGEEIVLKRTMGALRAMNNAPGGLENRINPAASTVISRLLARDLDTICMIIRVGAGAPNGFPKLPQMVFDEGVDEVVTPLCEYIFLLRSKPGTPLDGTGAAADEEGDGDEASGPQRKSRS